VTAIAVGSGDMPVLATPMMMALMENAAMLAPVAIWTSPAGESCATLWHVP